MRRGVFLMLFAFSLVFLYTACDVVDITPAPDVVIIGFDPVGVYVDSGAVAATIETIDFEVMNYVESVINEMAYVFHAVSDDAEVGSGAQGLGIPLAGGDEWCATSSITTVSGLMLDIADVVNYMFSNNENVVALITFTGEDAYGNEREFTCSMSFGIMMNP